MIVEIKVVPSSGKSKFIIDKSGRLKCYLKSPAERGLANHELIQVLSKALKVPQNKITIVSGATSRNKKVEIPLAITYADFLALLHIEPQMTVFDS